MRPGATRAPSVSHWHQLFRTDIIIIIGGGGAGDLAPVVRLALAAELVAPSFFIALMRRCPEEDVVEVRWWLAVNGPERSWWCDTRALTVLVCLSSSFAVLLGLFLAQKCSALIAYLSGDGASGPRTALVVCAPSSLRVRVREVAHAGGELGGTVWPCAQVRPRHASPHEQDC